MRCIPSRKERHEQSKVSVIEGSGQRLNRKPVRVAIFYWLVKDGSKEAFLRVLATNQVNFFIPWLIVIVNSNLMVLNYTVAYDASLRRYPW